MKWFHYIIVIAIALGAGYVGAKMAPSSPASAAKKTAYDRVMRSKTIRCGYINYPPHLIVDPATGAKSGIMHDIVEEAGRLLDLKIDWTEEVGWGTTVEALDTRRVDAICTSFWQNPVEGKYLGFTMPLFYSAVGAYVRQDDNRFDSGLDAADDAGVRISMGDGNIAFLIARQDFPKASAVSLPNMTDETLQLTEILTGKADLTFIETYLGEKFIQKNPGSLKNIAVARPVRLFGNTVAIPRNDLSFKTMLDSAFVQLLYGGTVDKIIRRYEDVPRGVYRVAAPYQAPE